MLILFKKINTNFMIVSQYIIIHNVKVIEQIKMHISTGHLCGGC